MVILALVAIPAYGAMEAQGQTAAPSLTFGDFQKSYSGTKPTVAVLKYEEYKWMLQYAPRPTLLISRIREGEEKWLALGTKPVVGYLKSRETKGAEMGSGRHSDFDPTTGTKPVVRALKK